MQRGLSESSEIKEEVVKVDDKEAIRYNVVEERIDLEALRREKAMLEEQLAVKEPTNEELVELGKGYHDYYTLDRVFITKRIKEINNILES